MAYLRAIKNRIGNVAGHEPIADDSKSPSQEQEEYTQNQEPHGSYMKKSATRYLSNPWKTLGWLLVVITLWGSTGRFGFLPTGDFPAMFGAKFQAVFLTNGQVYFGNLENYNARYVRLTNIYYLQVAQPLQQGQDTPQNFNLTKLGGELHGPEDAMFIDKDKVLFWENMKNDSQVVKAIEDYKAKLK